MFSLDGQIAIVTGGAGLYGAQISEALCEAGAKVIIASRNLGNCEKRAEKLRVEGYEAYAGKLDLEEEDSINHFVQGVIDRHQRIDILINNSVSRYGLKDIELTTAEGWEKAQKVNGLGLMLISKAVVTQMHKQGKGNIINISSIQGVLGPHFPVYGDTGMTSGIEYTYAKWGMIGITKWMANYYGKYNIRVNAISPGGYNPLGAEQEVKPGGFFANYLERTPLGRMAEDDDIKGSIVYLASEASRYITGHNVMLDGGWSNW
jgi:NAD(P)-dependent dehydrogenase (short-subunit alcohol dehydrogenase family)